MLHDKGAYRQGLGMSTFTGKLGKKTGECLRTGEQVTGPVSIICSKQRLYRFSTGA